MCIWTAVLIVEGWPTRYFCYCFANFLLSIVVYERLSTLFLFSADFSTFEFAEPVSLNSRWPLCLHCLDTGSQIISVGVLEDKSSSSRILEDNFEVLGLGLEACVLDSITANNGAVVLQKQDCSSMLMLQTFSICGTCLCFAKNDFLRLYFS